MPAQSPTLSPTLSAIVAGLRGSSSGMPASTLPTRSAPTSAALVKMPPPRPGEDRDQRAAEAEADERVHGLLLVAVEDRRQQPVVAGDAEQREADDEHAGDRAAAEGDVEAGRDAAPRGLGDARVRADRDVHADVAGGAREDATDDESGGDIAVLDEDQRDRQHDAGNDRWSCTGGSGRPGPPLARRPRCAASRRCLVRAPAAAGWSAARRPPPVRRIPAPRSPRGRSGSHSTQFLQHLVGSTGRGTCEPVHADPGGATTTP